MLSLAGLMLAAATYNTSVDDTHIIGCEIYEGGSEYNFGMFEMEIEINFEHVRGTL